MTIGVPLITFILSLVASEMQNKVGLEIIFICAVISIGLCLGVLFILSKVIYEGIISNADKNHNEIITLLDKKLGNDKLLMNTRDGVDFEKKRVFCTSCSKKGCKNKTVRKLKCKNYCEEIWLLTQDLEEDKEGGPYAQVVTDNLKKGIKYKYIVPKDDASIKTKSDDIITNNGNNPNLKFYPIDKNFFFLSPKLDLSIYNPIQVKGSERRAFMGIPLEKTGERYQVPVSDDLITTIVGTIKQQIEETQVESGSVSKSV
jgi:hypothetical protein